jgi:hypothetical protein
MQKSRRIRNEFKTFCPRIRLEKSLRTKKPKLFALEYESSQVRSTVTTELRHSIAQYGVMEPACVSTMNAVLTLETRYASHRIRLQLLPIGKDVFDPSKCRSKIQQNSFLNRKWCNSFNWEIIYEGRTRIRLKLEAHRGAVGMPWTEAIRDHRIVLLHASRVVHWWK